MNNCVFVQHYSIQLVLIVNLTYSSFVFFIFSVRKQVVNIPSFVVRLDSQKHIDFSTKSPFGQGRPGRVKRKNMKKGQSSGGAEEDEDAD